jgi:hypothetical protein
MAINAESVKYLLIKQFKMNQTKEENNHNVRVRLKTKNYKYFKRTQEIRTFETCPK